MINATPRCQVSEYCLLDSPRCQSGSCHFAIQLQESPIWVEKPRRRQLGTIAFPPLEIGKPGDQPPPTAQSVGDGGHSYPLSVSQL
jgi:hypothetical protein